MLVREAKWFRDRLLERDPREVFPLLNVGSQSEEFRKAGQPWVDKHLFAPLRAAGREVVHTDVWPAPGVDLVGNLLEPDFRQEIRARGFKSVLFSNVLEHVREPGQLSAAVAELVPAGGLLFVSAPYRFPYHPDPIDTLYRPDVEQLAAQFPQTAVERSALLRCGNLTGYLLARLAPNPLSFIKRAKQKAATPVAGETATRPDLWQMLPWLVRSFRISCVVLRRLEAA
jgi:hypothetical protein